MQSVLEKGGQGGGRKGVYDKRQPHNVCMVVGARRGVYLLMKSGQYHPPPSQVGVWQNRCTPRACTLSSGGGGGPLCLKKLTSHCDHVFQDIDASTKCLMTCPQVPLVFGEICPSPIFYILTLHLCVCIQL